MCEEGQAAERIENDLEDRAWLVEQRLAEEVDQGVEMEGPSMKKLDGGEEYVEEMILSLTAPLKTTHTVALAEVRANLPKWEAAIKKEIKALEDSGTIRRVPLEQAKGEARKGSLVLAPGKAVFTIKPPALTAEEEERVASGDVAWMTPEQKIKRKCRIVICGNYVHAGEGESNYASGAPAEAVRMTTAFAARFKWKIGGTDVSNAFTLTPMSEASTRYAFTPPKIIVMVDESAASEAWELGQVLYGLREAPQLWGAFRDRRLRKGRFPVRSADGGEYWCVLHQCEAEENMWMVLREDVAQDGQPGDPGGEAWEECRLQGMMPVYVDDLLYAGQDKVVEALHGWISKGDEEEKGWKTSDLAYATPEVPLRYLGMEIRALPEGEDHGFHINQAGYVADMLGKDKVVPSVLVCSKEMVEEDVDEEEDEEGQEAQPGLVAEAQRIAGELLWVSTRTRPEISFAVGRMCSMVTKRPQQAVALGMKVKGYLLRNPSDGLKYVTNEDKDEVTVAWSDASFAPGGGRSHEGLAVSVFGQMVAWRSTRQALVSMSVAEAELIAAVGATQMAAGLDVLVNEVLKDTIYGDKTIGLYVDNTAALTLTAQSGSWKTRHLKVRSRYLRQEVGAGRIVAKHVAGISQKADLLTKPLPSARLQELKEMWRLVAQVSSQAEEKKVILLALLCLAMGEGVAARREEEAGSSEGSIKQDGWFELLAMSVMFAVTVVVLWELGLWLWEKCGGSTLSRKERKRLKIKELVEQEIAQQTAGLRRQTSGAREQAGGVREQAGGVREQPGGVRERPGEVRERAGGVRGQADGVREQPGGVRGGVVSEQEEDSGGTGLRARRLLRTCEAAATRQETSRRASSLEESVTVPEALFEGPFYRSAHGEKIHLREGCYGLRNRTSPVEKHTLCLFCAREVGLRLGHSRSHSAGARAAASSGQGF